MKRTRFSLNSRIQPLRQYYVRKRKRGSETFLIYLTQVCRIDGFSECVWNLCDGEHTVPAILRKVSRRFGTVPRGRIAGMVLGNLEFFYENRLIEAADPDRAVEGRDSKRLIAPSDPLIELMKALRVPSAGSESRSTTVLIARRFYRILFEKMRALRRSSLNENAFRRFLEQQLQRSPRRAAAILKKDLSLRHWTYSPAEFKITMVFDDATYTGDLHNRL